MANINPEAEIIVKVTDFGESRAVATSYSGRDRLQNPSNYLYYLKYFFIRLIN